MEVIIDLTNKHRDKKNISLLWDISVQDRGDGIISKLPFIRRHQKIEKEVFLKIENIVTDANLVCDLKKLFTLVKDGVEYSQQQQPLPMQLSQLKNPFQIFLDLNSIIDCKERQVRVAKSYPISFDVVVADDDGSVIDKHREKIDVKFVPLDVKPQIRFELDTEKIQYSSQLKEVRIGQLVAWIEESYCYTPDICFNTSISLYYGNKSLDGYVYFKNEGVESTLISETLIPGRNNLKRYDVYVDFSNIANPIEHERKYSLVRQTKFSLGYSPEIVQPLSEEIDSFYVIKDDQGTEIKVCITDQATLETNYISNNDISYLSKYNFVPRSKMQSQVIIDLKNIATDSSNDQSGLLIKNLSISDNVRGEVHVLSERGDDLRSFTHIDGDDCEELISKNGLFIPNGVNAKTQLIVTFDPSEIADIVGTNSEYDFEVETIVSFDFFENKDGIASSDDDYQAFKHTLLWNLRLEPYPEWLCVDYGSSAIVCKYADELINLKEQKEELYSDEDNHYTQFTKDELEKGTKFLSSDIVFHTTDSNQEISSLCSEQNDKTSYDTLAVCLSPTSSLIMTTPTTQIPCLKILVGNEFLPENPHYYQFRYPCVDRKTGVIRRVTISETKNEPNSLLRISTIFKESYNALFRYFISPIAGDKRHMNKLVLTYPNTYTPVHLKILSEIASFTFPHLRPGYLKFVSESDAVASYYISHWSEFNEGDIADYNETVLVYDMGAGTLDVTIFDKFLNSDGKIEANIKGKLGTGKAGNYLDFIIAEIISEQLDLRSIFHSEVASTVFVANPAVLAAQHELKEFIKSVVKPNLERGKQFRYKVAGQNKTILADDIIDHPTFQSFLKEVSSDIMYQLCKYMDSNDLEIDTVIMSGRSCKLQFLREALRESIDSVTSSNVHYVDFQNVKGENREKTIVVEGAVAQASTFNSKESAVIVKSRRLYASYGIVFQGLGGKFKYVELLNHEEIPYNDAMGGFDGKIKEIKGTANSDFIRLVQSYLSETETESCYNNGDYEFISDMEEYSMSNFNNSNNLNVRLHLDKNNNISLFVNGRVSIGNTPRGVDLTSEITKRSIWPVTIYTES